MSGTSLINIGISGLRTTQAALATTGHNITNANTPGFSRQRVDIVPQAPQMLGVGYLGAGAELQSISRIVSDYAISQVRNDTALASEVESFLSQVSQVDSLLANESTGLVPALESFFGSIEASSSDPSSLPARQLVLSETSKLADRFHAMFERLEAQSHSLDDLAESAVGRITELARAIADMNDRVVAARSTSISSKPNDLLDQRDELIRRLSEIVGVTTVPQSDGEVNVFIGKGQPLVLGRIATPMSVGDNGDILLGSLGTGGTQVITSMVSGGELGGVIAFKTGVLDTVMNQLGRIALGVAEQVNRQHKQGITLDGVLGSDLFRDINTSALASARVTGIVSAPGSAASMRVLIDDIGALTTSDYELRVSQVNGQSYELVRRSDLAVVRHGQLTPGATQTIAVDGFRLVIDPSDLRAGDRYLIQPTRSGARDIARVLDDARDLAFASPVNVSASAGNRGSGVTRPGQVLDIDHPIFATPRALSPPLMIRFTSDTSYDVLDATDPARPVDLVPPRRNLTYVPGVLNQLLPGKLGVTIVAANGANAQSLPASSSTVASLVNVANTIGAETLTLTGTDPDTGVVLPSLTVAVTAGSSARAVADQLSALAGVDASAYTELGITALTDNGAGEPLAIAINGQLFTGGDVASLDALADAISANGTLRGLGITASSDGARLILGSIRGDDLNVHVAGDAADGVTLTDASGDTLALNGAGVGQYNTVSVGGTVTVSLDPGYRLTSNSSGAGNLFTATPPAARADLGLQVEMSGAPRAGDQFLIEFNDDGVSDNRNALALARLQTDRVLADGKTTLFDAYAQLVESVGSRTNEARIQQEAAEGLLAQSVGLREAVSGVNLDEEAANLIKFEHAYNASARVISVARDIFNVLFQMVA